MFLHWLSVAPPWSRPRRVRPRVRLQVESLESRCVLATSYLAADLVSDQPGVAPILDPNLINAWGLAVNPTGAFWVSSNGANLSTLYTGDVGGNPLAKVALEVDTAAEEPTGQVFNGTSDFVVSDGTNSGPAAFIFATEEGAVTGWNPAVPPPPPSTSAQVAFEAEDGAVYMGIALANNGDGNFLYLADFHNAKIDVLDGSFQLTTLDGSFTDPSLPAGFAPFNVAAIGDKLYVAYAQQDAAAEDEVIGPHLGFVNVFDLNGNFQQRLVSQGKLNAPWAMVQAPAGFGDFSGDLLVGNFGDGRINAYNPTTGAFHGTLSSSPGRPVEIDGLWGLAFGNGVSAGSTTTLYYAAGPDDETHGLFGKITANAAGTSPVTAALTGNELIITGSRDRDLVTVLQSRNQIVVLAGGTRIGTFPQTAVGTIQFSGLVGNDQINIAGNIAANAILDGGAGNDVLMAGRGNAILLGGTGDDMLLGSLGRDILIGGEGRDFLSGGLNDDLLIGGTTAYDSDNAALLQILAEWASADSYAMRITKLRTGAGGLPMLDATTVFDDAARDMLLGGAGLDWYFTAPPDLLLGKLAAEQAN
jgi:uncharacterized protein (TIGR03118 family)